ncbi:MAG: ATP-grasp domain-containing protein [Clostridiales bacterium]|nr:ATP-grasp domain-containing protein [Clostridiales bacterium]
MSGVLIYPKEKIEKNLFAIEKFKENLDVTLKEKGFCGEADFVINRTNDYHVGEFFEGKGIRVFNSSSLSRLANDKQLCYDFMEKRSIPIMPTRYTKVPVVKKPVDGSGGKDVVMLKTSEKFQSGYVYQEPCDTPGRDVRVWAIGGRIVTAVLRKSDNDFRSNFCLGGDAEIYNLTKEEREFVQSVIDTVRCDWAGFDFIFHRGRLVFNEIEDTVGARTVYAKTDIDIIKLYCDYIKNELSLS